MSAKSFMIQGTGSGVGKSVITAAFCRRLYLDGYKVAPFKAQNMSLNSFVTKEGGEMGRAQVYQAEACGIEPHVAMNPVLLKPCGDNLSQVIVMGKVIENRNANDYYKQRESYQNDALKAFEFLKKQYDWIVMEGAGSPAEINLREFDFVNMKMAKHAHAPVFIVGDIDRGGVFAWMKGTYDLLEPDERDLVKGFIINKFRGDRDLLTPGIRMFEEMAEKPVVGVIPFYRDLFVDEEDSIPYLEPAANASNSLEIAVIRLPRISNFTDISPLIHEPGVHVRYVWKPEQFGNPDLIIIPGSKNTLDDLEFLKTQGLDQAIFNCHQTGSFILGICAGFQMLGKWVRDPFHLESDNETAEGLSLLEMETTLQKEKLIRQVAISSCQSPVFPSGLPVEGYEIHMGTSHFLTNYPSLFVEENGNECRSVSNDDGTILGTYIHGFFDSDPLRKEFLNFVRRLRKLPEENSEFSFQEFKQKHLNQLTQLIDGHIDMNQVYELIA